MSGAGVKQGVTTRKRKAVLVTDNSRWYEVWNTIERSGCFGDRNSCPDFHLGSDCVIRDMSSQTPAWEGAQRREPELIDRCELGAT